MPEAKKITITTTKKTSSFTFRVPAWKRDVLKQIAEEKGVTMTEMFEEWLDDQIRASGVRVEVEV